MCHLILSMPCAMLTCSLRSTAKSRTVAPSPQEVVNSGIPSVILRVGATNLEEGAAAQSAISLGPQGSKPSNASISKSQARRFSYC